MLVLTLFSPLNSSTKKFSTIAVCIHDNNAAICHWLPYDVSLTATGTTNYKAAATINPTRRQPLE